jgi:hypothetical protein
MKFTIPSTHENPKRADVVFWFDFVLSANDAQLYGIPAYDLRLGPGGTAKRENVLTRLVPPDRTSFTEAGTDRYAPALQDARLSLEEPGSTQQNRAIALDRREK